MATLLHLHPGEVRARRELLERKGAWLRDRGVELVLADDWIAESDRALYAACVEVPPAEQVERSLARLLEFSRERRLDGVIVQTEAALPVGSLLTQALGLAGPRPAAALRCVGKQLTRATLAAAKVPQPEFALARDAADVRRFAARHGFPLVLKAFASTMSRLVTPLHDERAIEAGVARVRAGLAASTDVARLVAFARAAGLERELLADPRDHFLVEQYAPGEPVETDGFVVAGEPRLFGALEQAMTTDPPFYVEAYLLPADRPLEQRRAIEDVGARAAKALGLDASGFSIELRHERPSAAAGGGVARVIEVNGRLGEDEALHQLFARRIGADPFELSVELALGGAPRFEVDDASRRALVYQCAFDEGTVARVPSPAAIDELSRRVGGAAERGGAPLAGLCVKVGDAMHAPPHPETFPHLAWVLASDATSSRAALERGRALVRTLEVAFAK